MAEALPRYQPGQERKPKEVTVDLPELGASFVLRRFNLRERTDWLKENSKDGEDDERSVAEILSQNETLTVELVARCLVEPKLTVDELSQEIQSWPPEDFDVLSDKATELIGFNKEALRAAEAKFRDES